MDLPEQRVRQQEIERRIDEALRDSFPASDPSSFSQPH